MLGDKQPDWLEVSVSRGEEDPNSVSLAQLVRLREGEEDEEKRRAELFERWLHSPERTKKWRRRLMRLEEADEAQMEVLVRSITPDGGTLIQLICICKILIH